MKSSAVACVRHLINEYRRFLRTSYRFLDEHLRKQFEDHLAQADIVVRGPYVTLSRDFERGSTLSALVGAGRAEGELLKAEWPFGDEPLYLHQERAFETGRLSRSFVVTTGTGSGKTEAFMLPVFDGIIRRKREGVRGVQAVFLYPMNALANDQLERLRRLLRGTGVDISFALYTGDSDTASRNLREEPAENERTTRAAIRRNPPDVLLTNYKQLEFLLIRSEDRILFTEALRYLVLDELHSYRGALATEIACLIRRLKAHAGVASGQLIGIGTSATVSSGAGGAEGLANFATVLFGDTFRAEDIIGESLVERPAEPDSWVPPAPLLDGQELRSANFEDDEKVVALAERLTGRSCPSDEPLADRIKAVLTGNVIVQRLEEVFSEPSSITDAVSILRDRFPDRASLPEESVRCEVEGYLLVGSMGDDDHPPRLRPKLHTFFHGVYDVSLCLNPACRSLVPHGGTECPQCGSAARPAALCRTCGQDFLKVRFERETDNLPVGTGDFYSDERTAFLTYQVHQLPEADPSDEEPSSEEQEEPSTRKTRRRADAEDRLGSISVCISCGRILAEGISCPACNRGGIPYLIHHGPMHACPACGDVYTRGDIVTPLRTGTASTMSALTTHHLDLLEGDDRKLLVFADNRQDVAHQAGYTADKHRAFALRHLVAHEVSRENRDGIYLQELPQRLFDEYQRIGIIKGRPTRPERERWLDAISYELANEFTRYTRQRASLENLGLVAAEYEFLEDLEKEPAFIEAASQANISPEIALAMVRVILDVMRKNRAVGFDFFQEYIDPGKKRKYRELEAEPYGVRFPDRDRNPKGFALNRPDHIRKSKSGIILGFYQENPRAGQLTAVQKVAVRVIGNRGMAESFLKKVIPLLVQVELLAEVPHFPIPRADRVGSLKVLQINPKVIRLVKPESGYRCNACQTWRPYDFPTCPTPKCTEGSLHPASIDRDNYYVHLYTDRPPQRLAVAEHSAQIPGEERAKRETAFKEGKLDALVCTPTLELGVDIGPLLTVALRNAPPTPANYVQRVGRAGRRLRIGFVSTFCAGGAHDRHAFENPTWLVAGHFTPPRIRLDNPRIFQRHLRSFLLESIEAQLPRLMGEFLDDLRTPGRLNIDRIIGLFEEVHSKSRELSEKLESLFAQDREAGRTTLYGKAECEKLVDGLEADVKRTLNSWWRRIKQLNEEFHQYSTIGSPVHDMKKAQARRRAYDEITRDPERAYTLNYLSTQGLLPAYQFPVDTFSLDPGVVDTATLYRAAAVAIEEFAPGNFVYANGHKLKSIRVLFAGGPGQAGERPARSDAETSGRLRSFQFCERCDEVTEDVRNSCSRCGAQMPGAVDCVFVDAFEAEESLRIGSDEESRQRQYHVRRESLLTREGGECRLYPYPYTPVEYRKLGEVLITNWGRTESKTGEGMHFWLCPDCGRHQPHDPFDTSHARVIQTWRENHSRICSGEPVLLVLAYQFQTDCLVLNVPNPQDSKVIGKAFLSPKLVTLTEALLAGAADLLELESYEIAAFPRLSRDEDATSEIVFYETVPGGAGYAEEIARRLPEVAQAARERLYKHDCVKGCYLCLKHYRNQRWHHFFDKDCVRDVLLTISKLSFVEPIIATGGDGIKILREALDARRLDLKSGGKLPGEQGPQSPIESLLLDALRAIPDMPVPICQFEIRDGDRLITIPDFAYPDIRVAIFCDGFAFHGNPDTLELDARKRNWLQQQGWAVLTYWGKTTTRDAVVCAREIFSLFQQRAKTRK
jgi:ATP-dependent helicase YprA (DUF1998 family)/ribosomal protein L32